MNIPRVATFSLAVAVAVFALGYAGPAFALPPVCPSDHPSCKGDDGGKGGDKDTTVIGVHADNTVPNSGAPVWAPTDTFLHFTIWSIRRYPDPTRGCLLLAENSPSKQWISSILNDR